jgi:hypothetical protein
MAALAAVAPSPSSSGSDVSCGDAYGHYEYSLLLSAILTFVCSCAQLYLFCSKARFRSHLSRLVLYRTFFDCVFAIITCINLEMFASTNLCTGSKGTVIAFLTQVTFIAAEMCFLVIAGTCAASVCAFLLLFVCVCV